MILYILMGIFGIVAIVGMFLWIFGKIEDITGYTTTKTVGCTLTIGFIFVTFIVSMVTISTTKKYKEEINTFKKQKEYIEQVAPTLPTTDNYALTIKRIEQNQWLYEIQYKYENYRFWYLIPEEVLDLTPIK